jgi:hypothetical protein
LVSISNEYLTATRRNSLPKFWPESKKTASAAIRDSAVLKAYIAGSAKLEAKASPEVEKGISMMTSPYYPVPFGQPAINEDFERRLDGPHSKTQPTTTLSTRSCCSKTRRKVVSID